MTKTTLLAGLFLTTGALFLGSCSEDSPSGVNGTGSLAPTVALDSSVKAPRQSRADGNVVAPEAGDLSLRLTSTDATFTKSWASLAEFGESQEINVGTYTLEAWHGDADNLDGYDCPYFYGSTPVKIEDSKTTTVALTASLAQAIVTVSYTERLLNYISDYTAKVNGIVYDAGKTLYLAPGTAAVTLSFTKPNGTKAEDLELVSFSTKARTRYNVKLDLNGEYGDATLTVTYDDEMDTHVVPVDISDKVLNAPGPRITPQGFTAGETISFIAGMDAAKAVRMDVIAPGKLAHVTLTTAGTSLNNQGWPEELDLMTATSEQQDLLRRLGFKALGLWNNPDEMAVLDFSGVAAHIAEIAGDNTTTFTVGVTDKNGKSTEEALTFSYLLEPLVLEITGADTYEEEQPLNIYVDYNGEDLASKVSFEYYTDRATWAPVSDVTVQNPASRAATTYTVTLGGLPKGASVKLRAKCGNVKTSNEFTAKGAPYEVSAADNDIYAWKALVTVNGTEGQDQATLADGAKYLLSADGGSTYAEATGSRKGNYFEITGLTPGKEYKVKVQIDGINSRSLAFTTESDIQLPNSDMETWYRQAGQTDYWWIDYPGADTNAVWGTLNQLTTSIGDSHHSATSHKGAAYCSFSGTRPTGSGFPNRGIRNGSANEEKARTGSYAAVISTVGWGSNDAGDGLIIKCRPQYLTPGELYLGKYENGANYTGLAHGSRPSSLTFWYYYCVKNSADYGYAEIQVKDAAGNVIASGSKNLNAAADYTEATIALTYADHSAKAATICVLFKSSNNPDCLNTGSTSNYTQPAYGNLTDGRFTGSELFIDDIRLNY